jgi:hypothetical protein
VSMILPRRVAEKGAYGFEIARYNTETAGSL